MGRKERRLLEKEFKIDNNKDEVFMEYMHKMKETHIPFYYASYKKATKILKSNNSYIFKNYINEGKESIFINDKININEEYMNISIIKMIDVHLKHSMEEDDLKNHDEIIIDSSKILSSRKKDIINDTLSFNSDTFLLNSGVISFSNVSFDYKQDPKSNITITISDIKIYYVLKNGSLYMDCYGNYKYKKDSIFTNMLAIYIDDIDTLISNFVKLNLKPIGYMQADKINFYVDKISKKSFVDVSIYSNCFLKKNIDYIVNEDDDNVFVGSGNLSEITNMGNLLVLSVSIIFEKIAEIMKNKIHIIRNVSNNTYKSKIDRAPNIDKDNDKKDNIIKLNEFISINAKSSETRKNISNTIRHKCEYAYTVSGHWRHYKNGKKVFIKSYVKNKDKEFKQKQYVL